MFGFGLAFVMEVVESSGRQRGDKTGGRTE